MSKINAVGTEWILLALLLVLSLATLSKSSRNVIGNSSSGVRLTREREKSIDAVSVNGNVNVQLRKYGESCNETHKCNFNDWLTCDRTSNTPADSSLVLSFTSRRNVSATNEKKNKEGTCVCRDSDDLFFEAVSNRCVARVGATCRRLMHLNDESTEKPLKGNLSLVGIQNGLTNINMSYPLLHSNTNENRIAKRIDCVHNAICDPTPVFAPRCRCHKGYYSTSNGTCQMQKTAPEPCSSSDECILLLSCIDNVCQCKGSLIFDKKENRCAIPNGDPCEPLESNHIQNQRTLIKFQHCSSKAACDPLTKTCQCKNGPTSLSSDGSCRPIHGESCSKDNPCSDSYACHNGTCACKFHLHQQYDTLSKQCKSLVQGPCQEKTAVITCTENAHCSDTIQGAYKECRCNNHYFDTPDGKCLKGYQTECAYDKECYPTLFCIDFKCQCLDQFQIFNPDTRRCEGVVGSRCSLLQLNDTNTDLASSISTSSNCISHAKCVSHNFTHSYGRCECDKDLYIPNSDRICITRA